MAKWSLGTESGILRKKVAKDKYEDLLVFGYACKLFRDDEKALYIDQGKHLIPWMGDDALKIDRYDCRGALSELHQYEAGREDYDTLRWLGLNESERRIELKCDEERYYSLKHNDEELEMYKEEELKRLHQKGSEVQYNYDVPGDPDNLQEIREVVEQEDQPFVAPTELDVPEDMTLPKTVKENARIEKTALFISKQGPQMEILIKTKQADNPQFSFMNKDDQLYRYYKHLVEAIKSGKYRVEANDTNTDQKQEESAEQDGHDEHYLHPSLLATSVQSAPSPLPSVVYKPSADCTYSQLVNRIQGTQSDSATPPPQQQQQQPVPDLTPVSVSYEQQQQYYQQYYYAAQYYEYYKHVAQQFQAQPQDKIPQDGVAFAQQAPLYPPVPGTPALPSQLNMQSLFQSQAAYMQYLQQQSSTNSYAQIVSNLSHSKEAGPAYAGFMPADPSQLVPNSDITKAPILYNQGDVPDNISNIPPQGLAMQPELAGLPHTMDATLPDAVTETKPKPSKKPLLSLAQYGSDSENENSDDEQKAVKVPPSETQQIIDKMASYVLKNGKDFENIVRSKGDPRFKFLNENHEYHPYYKMKIKESLEKISSNNENIENKEVKEQHNGTANKPKEKKMITPVSFSIKKPKDEVPKEIKSALPIEESDEEGEEDDALSKTPPSIPPPVICTLPVLATTVTISFTTAPSSPCVVTSVPAKLRSISRTPPPRDAVTSDAKHENKEELVQSEDKVKVLDSDDLIMEMIDLTDDLEERRETKRVENRKMDKIAAAAREKLALQLERKKKAAAFLKLKSAESSTLDLTKSDVKIEKPKKRKSDKHKHDSVAGKHVNSKKSKGVKEKERSEDEILKVDDSESEEGEIKKPKKSSKKKKSHKRKRSRSRHVSKSSHKTKEHKKSKKHRKRSESYSSQSSHSS